MNKHTLKGMMTFLLLLAFFSCKKENTQINSPVVASQVDVRVYSDQIAQYQTFLKDILTLLISEGVNHPEIFGLQSSNTALTRTGCPCSTTTDTGGGFPKTLTLEFGAGGAGCTLQNDYEGSLIFNFNAPLFQQVFDTEFSMSFNNFSINGYNLSSAGSVFFNYNPNIANYMIILSEDVVVEKDGITTTYKKLTDEIGGLLEPSTCGCFLDGLLLLRESTNNDCNNTVTSVFYEYDVDANGVDNEACDGYVSVNNVIELFQPNCL